MILDFSQHACDIRLILLCANTNMHAQFFFLPPGFRKQTNLSFDQDNYFFVSFAVKAPFAYAEGCIQMLERIPYSLYIKKSCYFQEEKNIYISHTGVH